MRGTIVLLSSFVLATACRAKGDVAIDSALARIPSPDTIKADPVKPDSGKPKPDSARADSSAHHSPATAKPAGRQAGATGGAPPSAKPARHADTTVQATITYTDSGYSRVKLPDGRSFKIKNPGSERSIPLDSFPKKP